MYPGPIVIFGVQTAPWNVLFLLGTIAGFLVLRLAFGSRKPLASTRFLLVRYVIVVYICTIAAQMLAYAADANTTLMPADGSSLVRYYLHPLAGPKTLYGAIIALPVAVAVAFSPFRRMTLSAALNIVTPALMTVLGFARVGCFLQGCCYGLRAASFGVVFPAGSSVHADQVLEGLVRIEQASLPVLPTQLASAATCFALAAWSWRALRNGSPYVFAHTIALYSAFRFVIELVRADQGRNHAGPFSTSQWIALLILSVVALTRRHEIAPSRRARLDEGER